MTDSTLLNGDLALLTAALDDQGTDLQVTIGVLADKLAGAWPPHAGLTMTVVLDGVAVTLCAGDRDRTATSEFSARNQAVGVLIEQGHTPDEARIEIHRRATHNARTLIETAQGILDNLPEPAVSTRLGPLGLTGVIAGGNRNPTLNRVVHRRTDADKEHAVRMRQPTSRARTGSTRGASLTTPELAVLRLLVAGSSTAAIASTLLLVPGTVRNHTHAIMAKLGAHSRVETVAISLSKNILGTP